MTKIKYLIIILIPLFLSGCYNYRELNDLGITTAVSIDYDKDKNSFNVIAQLINPVKQQDATSSGEPVFVSFQSEGKTIQEAFRLIILDSPKQLYGSHLQIVILSEEAVQSKLPEILDFFIRDPELRSEFKVIIAKNNESLKSISIQTLLDNLSSSNLLASLETQSKKVGIATIQTLNEITNMYLNPHLEIIMPSLILEGNIQEGESQENVTNTTSKANVFISTTAIFKDNKLITYLTEEESKALNLIKGDLEDTILNVNIDDDYIVFEPNRVKTKEEVDIQKNKLKVSVEGFARINEVSSYVDLTSPKEIDRLKDELNKTIEEMIKNTFYKIRDEYKTDVFGINNLYYKKDPKYFKENCQNWYEDIFPNIEIEVKSNLKLYEKGNTLGGVEYERENK